MYTFVKLAIMVFIYDIKYIKKTSNVINRRNRILFYVYVKQIKPN